MKPLSAGSEVDAWCTRCRMDLSHRIVAMVQGLPKRVECQTCGSQHNYRAPKTGGVGVKVRRTSTVAKPKSPTVSQRAKAEQDRAAEWESRILGQAANAFTRYSIDRTFSQGDLVLHRKFGEGFVEEVLEDGKINVMFRDGAKTLVHGQS